MKVEVIGMALKETINRHKFFKILIELVLNPVSPITILGIGFVLSMILNNGESNPEFIKKLINYLNAPTGVVIIVFWILFTVFYAYHRSEVVIVDELKEKLKKKDREIEYNSGIIINKYSELAKFNKIQKFDSLLKSVVDSHSFIQTAQLYKFNSKLEDNKCFRYKLKYMTGYAYENYDTNSILQCYYNVPFDFQRKFEKILNLNFDVANSNFESEDSIDILFEEIEDKFFNLSKEILDEIKKRISNGKICNDIADLYRILVVLIALVQNDYASGVDIKFGIDDPNASDLQRIKRTGVLGSMLLKDHYIFKHSGPGHKQGRVYLSYYFEMFNEEHIILLSSQSESITTEDDEKMWYNIFKKIIDDLTDMLNSEFN
jgi:fumarate reductase subunit D